MSVAFVDDAIFERCNAVCGDSAGESHSLADLTPDRCRRSRKHRRFNITGVAISGEIICCVAAPICRRAVERRVEDEAVGERDCIGTAEANGRFGARRERERRRCNCR
jgi:hypothetical protein